MLQGCSLALLVQQEEVGAAEVVVVGRVRPDGVQEAEKVVPQDMVKTMDIQVTRITMPMQLVEEEVKVPVVVQRVELDQVLGLAMAPALVRVVPHQPLVGMGLPMLLVTVEVKAKVLVPMELAEKEPERVVVREMVRAA
jgi:hypothetical protein